MTFNHGVEGSSPSALTNEINRLYQLSTPDDELTWDSSRIGPSPRLVHLRCWDCGLRGALGVSGAVLLAGLAGLVGSRLGIGRDKKDLMKANSPFRVP